MSERKKVKAEEELEIYKCFFKNTQDFVCIANTQGYFEVVNPYLQNILGYTEKELLKTPFLDFIHPDDVDASINEAEKLKKGIKTASFVNRYHRKTGEYQ